MAETRYPVIDYLTCTECGTCVVMCPHGVYDTEKTPSPVVKNIESCIDHCHSCGNRCPVGAITYIGDGTGWRPPKGEQTAKKSCCSRGCDCAFEKKINVEYLYLDRQTCARCIGTDSILDEVMLALTPALKLAGFTIDYKKIEMKTAAIAIQHQFRSSPTIRVNGHDICKSIAENSCGCCSEISNTDVECRVFEYNGETFEVPPKEMLAEGILKFLFSQSDGGFSCDSYELPENLIKFFDGKKNKSSCSCEI